MRRHLVLATLALVALTGTAALAQTDPYGRPINPGPYYNDRLYQDDDRDTYRYGGAPYVRPYPDYRPYDQRAQRGGGLRILEAWYGRGRRVCDASHALRSICEGRQDCTFKAGNELCGDPLPNVVKGLSVTFRCRGQTRQVDEMESRHLGLRCD